MHGLEICDRVVQHAHNVRELSLSNGFPFLDELCARKLWGWAGHVVRLPEAMYCTIGSSFGICSGANSNNSNLMDFAILMGMPTLRGGKQ